MTLSRSLIGGLACLVLLAGCGGSSGSSSTTTGASASGAATSGTAATSATSSSAATTAAPGTSSTGTAATTTASASAPPEAAGGRHRAKPRPSVSSGATIPAAFLLQHGKLQPSAVAVPAGVTIALGVTNRDHAGYSVVLVGQGRHTLHVKPAGGAVLLIHPLPKGSYPVLLNGAKQATLTVGATGGP